jgi:signal transduction histidine kinase
VFTVLVLIFQFERERTFQKNKFEVTLDNMAELSHIYYRNRDYYEPAGSWMFDSLTLLSPNLEFRVTIIDLEGNVVFDSEVGDVSGMENHLHRPEVEAAALEGKGSNIRQSETTGRNYYYYARAYPDYIVRVAAIYDVEVRDILHVERMFFAYLALLFIVFSLVLMVITRRVSETITKLKDFAIMLRGGQEPPETLEFPEDDLGEISSQITSIYHELNEARQEIQNEQEKLFTHLDSLNEGIAFFTPEKKRILANEPFIQNLNIISGQSAVTPEDVFHLPVMSPVVEFVEQILSSPESISARDLPSMSTTMQRSNKYFNVRCMFFADRSFEVVIANTTRLEKRKRITQEMTSNIAHELKTPVTSILGYLETLMEEDVPEKMQKRFLKGALRQTERLSGLIGDISYLNMIEETTGSYVMEKVKIRKIVDEVYQHMKLKLEAKQIQTSISIPKGIEIKGNVSMLYSIFYNLFENVIKYAGDDIEIWLDNYLEDRKYYYFSFANSGNSVEEIHLNRIFERFYRIDKARSREEGGTGLGLAIVKNAVEQHGGTITAKARPEGGLEFLFSLSK